MNFASDNAAGIAPDILAAISRANDGAALAYGRDVWTGQSSAGSRKFSSARSRCSWWRPGRRRMRWRWRI